MTRYQFTLKADLSEIAGDKKIISASIGPEGEACLLLVPPKYEKQAFGGEKRKSAFFPFSKPRRDYPGTFIRFDGQVLQQTELPEIGLTFPSVQPLPDGEILLVGARCSFNNGDPERNAVVFNRSGEVTRGFVLGDGINSVQATRDGTIWVSYFDEGIFGNFGWNKPIGASGLVCFDSHGRVIWEFKPPRGVDTMADCYALNVASEAVWTCYYTDFPLVKIDSNKQVRAWKNNIDGANALAIDRRRVAFWGGYGENHSRFVLQEISDERLCHATELPLELPNGISAMRRRVIARGEALHAFVETSWVMFSLDTIPDPESQG